ncbi:MAG: hypothetical protein JEZ10_03895 [Verrucomicrobia bacterium]|nr:hypothetical protein [Verrucomicrobiota bacterium]
MKPEECCKSFADYVNIDIEIIKRFSDWYDRNLQREPEEQDYFEFLMAISMAQRQPERPKAEKQKEQLERFSTAIKKMDIFTKEQLAKKAAREIAEKNLKERMRFKKARDSRDSLDLFLENPARIMDFLIKVYDTSCEIASEEAEKKFNKKTIARDKAKTVVQVLAANYHRFSKHKPHHANSSFVELVELGLEAIDYPFTDPSRLIKECSKERGRVDLWYV